MWYNGGMRWFNLNTGIIILVIIIILLAIGMGIVGYSLWNVPKAKELFPFLEISEVFPTKVIALFTGLATFGTLLLALATIVTIKNSNEQEKRRREDELAKEKRDRDERLLNEIIDWASGCMSCAFEINRPRIGEAKSTEQYINRMQIELEDKLRSFKTKTGYIKGIATPSLFGQSLSKAVNISIECLDLTIKLIEKDNPNPNDEEEVIKQAKEELDKFMKRESGGLYKCMNEVLEEAVKVKTRNLS